MPIWEQLTRQFSNLILILYLGYFCYSLYKMAMQQGNSKPPQDEQQLKEARRRKFVQLGLSAVIVGGTYMVLWYIILPKR